MADEGKAATATLRKLTKLHETWFELAEKMAAVNDEIKNLLAGGPGIGELMKRLEHHFGECWNVRYRGEYVFNFAKDVPQLKRLIAKLGADEVERRMLRYLQNEDPFFMKARHSFGAFVASINQHAAAGGQQVERALQDEVEETESMLLRQRRS